MMTYRHALGEVLREMRNKKKATLRSVAHSVPMALGYLSEVERGQKELSSDLLASIADYYRVPTSTIVIEAGILLASWEIPNTVPTNFGKELVVGF